MRRFGERKKDFIFYSILLAWPILQFCVFYIGVNINSVLLAFKKYETEGVYIWVGFDNFKTLFENFREMTVFSKGLINSITAFFAGTAFGMLFSLLFSFYIYKKKRAGEFFKTMLFLPSIIPSIALIVMFKQFADNAVPAIVGLSGREIRGLIDNPDTVFGTIIFYNIWAGFGTSVLLYVGAMKNIPDSVTDAAKLDGAGYLREFISITLPMIWGTFSTFLVIAVGGIFINQLNVYAFFGSGAEERVVTIGYWLYKETVKSGAYASYPDLAAFGILLSLIAVPMVYLVKWALRKFGYSSE